ncbi:hypothetical protein [Oharaeibacter diazotrophicus]|uniref:hypothetical protein n=1 Tax=Oharaeibacter diazotrophicus TaxID=1920512 RepID=UPI000F818496|nr:hypothetical protein [Oharaeibacter diazotrophicus]GLS76325.1 hypothetical protein GCM10007904_16600 [Oharaeibacter diazotrophicus]
MRRRSAVFVLFVLLAGCQSKPASSTFGPVYDGPVGYPGFDPPEWMLQDFCAQGDSFDFCQGFTIEEQRAMLLAYRLELALLTQRECGGATTWVGVNRLLDAWGTKPPKAAVDRYQRATEQARDDFEDLRKRNGNILCQKLKKIPDLDGFIE